MTNDEFIPADHGIATAAYNDARRDGLGDDDTADMIFDALAVNSRELGYDRLYAFAYGLITRQRLRPLSGSPKASKWEK